LPLVLERDVLGVDDFATHRVPLDRGPEAYAMFQRKEHGAVKVLFDMAAGGGADGPREAATSITPDSMDDADVTNGEAGVLSGRAT